MGRWARRIGLALGTIALVGAAAVLLLVQGVAEGRLGAERGAGTPSPQPRARASVEQRTIRQARARAALPGTAETETRQILFGDLHVHTTFSSDAFLFSLPLVQGEGAHPPADACDFARYCSALDFWSINDHAELLTPRQWQETTRSVRECNAVAGDSSDPDLVTFLGWEWTQMGATPETHYGHKNVILRDIEEERIPARPISAGRSGLDDLIRDMPVALRAGLAVLDPAGVSEYAAFNRWRREAVGTEPCPVGVDVRELPTDCLEGAPTPALLFEKLAQWDLPSLVIPHGTSWGIHAPPGADLSAQLATHDPGRERLFEVYSGHGSSEVHRAWRHVERNADGGLVCPAPRDGFTPCCWRAGELALERCTDPASQQCAARVGEARRLFVEASTDPRRFGIVPGATPEDYGECGVLPEAFLPAYLYRPGMSAQTGLARSGENAAGEPVRMRFGLIASSDNHKARAGSGYKEFARKAMGDAWGWRSDLLDRIPPVEPTATPVPLEDVPPGLLLLPERGASFYYTGGLVAAHARGRNRGAIFDALESREVYGTSGDRILLWFDLLGPERVWPMGSEVEASTTPHFRVRAVGAFEQQAGCPEPVTGALTAERLQRLCLGECYHPSERRKRIERVEVVRIRAQRGNEALGPLIQDPWRSFACPPDRAGCRVEFEDPEFGAAGREIVYYVRALQEPSPAVGGDPLRCERDARGDCLAPRPCYASGPGFDPDDDCRADVQERAWSSPIFVRPSAPAGASG